MAFSDDAIGFFLQLDDQMSPVLATAATNYSKFVKVLDGYNKKATASAGSAFKSLADLADKINKFPSDAKKAYANATQEIEKALKPIRTTIKVALTPKSMKSLSNDISKALTKVLSQATLRLSATLPIKKSPKFDTSVPLNQLYQEMAQPPDFRGGFLKSKLPKFEEGGVVEGPGQRGMDSVLAMLAPGELVVPTDVVDKLKEMAESAPTELPEPFLDTYKRIQVLAATLEGLKQSVELGLDPTAATRAQAVYASLDKEVSSFRDQMTQMPKESQRRLIPTLKDINDEISKFTEQTGDAEDSTKSLLKAILGPTAFMAAREALEDVNNVMSSLYGNVGDTFSQLEGDQIDDFVTNINQMNKVLGLSRDELLDFKNAALSLSKSIDNVNPTELTEAMEAMTEAGIDNKDVILGVAGAIAAMDKIAGVSRDTMAEMAVELISRNDMSEESFNNLSASVMGMGDALQGVQTTQLIEGMKAASTEMGSFFKTLPDEAKRNVMETTAIVSGAFAENFGGDPEQLSVLLAKATKDHETASKAFGMSIDQVAVALEQGRAEDLIASLGGRFTALESDFARARLAEALDLDFDDKALAQIGMGLDDIQASAVKARNQLVPMGDEMQVLSDAAGRNVTMFDKIAEGFTETVGSMQLFGVSGIDVLDFFKEFNPQAALSIARLGQMAFQAVFAGGKLFSKLGGGLSGATKGMAALNKTTEQATSISAAAPGGGGLGGFLKGIGDGMVSLGKGLASVIGSIGKGIGQLISGVFTGIAQGLSALATPQVAIGLAVAAGIGAVVVGMAIGLAYAADVAKDPLQILATGINDMVETFSSMSPAQILATAGAFAAIGPSFLLLSHGVLASSIALAASVPGFALFAGAMALLGSDGDMGLSGTINGIIDSFSVSPKKLKTAIQTVENVAEFLDRFMGVSARFAVLAGGAVLAKGVSGLVSIFSGKSPMAMLADQAKEISDTAVLLTDSFSSAKGLETKLVSTAVTVNAIGTFTQQYARAAKAMGSISRSAVKSAIGDRIIQLFAKNSGSKMDLLAKKGKEIVTTVTVLSKSFSKVSPSLEQRLPRVASTVASIGTFTEGFSKASSAFEDIKPGILGQWLKVASDFWGGNQIKRLTDQSDEMIATVTTLVTDFSDVQVDGLDGAVKTLTGMGDFMDQFAFVAEVIDDLDGNWLSGVLGVAADFWGGGSSAEKLAEQASNIKTTVTKILTELGNSNVTPEAVSDATVTITAMGDLMKSFTPLITVMGESGDVMDKFDDKLWGVWSGSLTKLSEGLPKVVSPASQILDFTAKLVEKQTVTKSDAVGMIDDLYWIVKEWQWLPAPMAAFGDALDTHSGGMEKAYKQFYGVWNPANRILSETQYLYDKYNRTASDQIGFVKDVTNLVKEWYNVPVAMTALGRQMGHANLQLQAEAEIDMKSVKQQLNQTMLSATDVNKIITVQLDPDTTDQPVKAELERVNRNLENLTRIMENNGMQVREVRAAPAPRGPSEGTRSISRGDY